MFSQERIFFKKVPISDLLNFFVFGPNTSKLDQIPTTDSQQRIRHHGYRLPQYYTPKKKKKKKKEKACSPFIHSLNLAFREKHEEKSACVSNATRMKVGVLICARFHLEMSHKGRRPPLANDKYTAASFLLSLSFVHYVLFEFNGMSSQDRGGKKMNRRALIPTC